MMIMKKWFAKAYPVDLERNSTSFSSWRKLLYIGSNRLQKTKAATGGVLKKNVFLKISQYSQENTCVGVENFY